MFSDTLKSVIITIGRAVLVHNESTRNKTTNVYFKHTFRQRRDQSTCHFWVSDLELNFKSLKTKSPINGIFFLVCNFKTTLNIAVSHSKGNLFTLKLHSWKVLPGYMYLLQNRQHFLVSFHSEIQKEDPFSCNKGKNRQGLYIR